ncbi:MAG: GTP-binding protein [Bacteroidales bacterium]|nr:GTP-binding protein [Bacteroidales bacterium]
MERKELPVLLLTGYLGSGKTTLLNRILSNRRGIKFAVIVNDIGEVNIDSDLIEKGGIVGQGDDSLVALQNGCICCTLKMDLVAQLDELARMNRFDYIVIEASGICEPAPIAQTICSIPQLVPQYMASTAIRLDCIVTVVDALRMRDEFGCGDALRKEDIGEEDLERLVIEQIEFCNMVLLNKASDVTPDELAKVRDIVHALNPKAVILECDYGDVDLDKLLNTNLFDFDKVATSAAWIAAIENGEEDHDDDDDDDDDDHDHDHHHHHHHHDEGEAEEYGIGTYVYYRRPALDLNKFDNFVARYWPKEIIRAKGLCYFYDEPDKCYLFETAGKQKSIKDAGYWFATMPEDRLEELMARDKNLRRDWDPEYGDRMIKIVFIGQNLRKELIEELMDSCLAE